MTWPARITEKEMAQAVRESEERYARWRRRRSTTACWDWDLVKAPSITRRAENRCWASAAPRSVTGPRNGSTECTPTDRAPLLGELSARLRPAALAYQRAPGQSRGRSLQMGPVPRSGRPRGRGARHPDSGLADRHHRALPSRGALYATRLCSNSLTGLPNRVLFMDRLSQAVANAKRRPGYTYTVLWLEPRQFQKPQRQSRSSVRRQSARPGG